MHSNQQVHLLYKFLLLHSLLTFITIRTPSVSLESHRNPSELSIVILKFDADGLIWLCQGAISCFVSRPSKTTSTNQHSPSTHPSKHSLYAVSRPRRVTERPVARVSRQLSRILDQGIRRAPGGSADGTGQPPRLHVPTRGR